MEFRYFSGCDEAAKANLLIPSVYGGKALVSVTSIYYSAVLKCRNDLKIEKLKFDFGIVVPFR
jgi:hypothetical protein